MGIARNWIRGNFYQFHSWTLRDNPNRNRYSPILRAHARFNNENWQFISACWSIGWLTPWPFDLIWMDFRLIHIALIIAQTQLLWATHRIIWRKSSQFKNFNSGTLAVLEFPEQFNWSEFPCPYKTPPKTDVFRFCNAFIAFKRWQHRH